MTNKKCDILLIRNKSKMALPGGGAHSDLFEHIRESLTTAMEGLDNIWNQIGLKEEKKRDRKETIAKVSYFKILFTITKGSYYDVVCVCMTVCACIVVEGCPQVGIW